MSVYYKPRNCLYIHIPKTGGGSVEYLLGGSGHFAVGYYFRRLKEFNEAFKFAFVREPFLRFVSTLNHTRYSPETVIGKILDNDYTGIKSELYKHQYKFLYFKGACYMNYIGRYENLEVEYQYLADLLFLPKELPHQNKGILDPADYLLYKPLIHQIYKEDYEIFYPEITLLSE